MLNRSRSWSALAVIGPGLVLAATGVGAGDLAGGAFAGSKLGVAVLWAVLLGAIFKYFITEGLARWQLATGQTLLEGAVLHLGRPVQWFFLVYLLVWTFGVGTALMSACGVAANALFPVFDDPVHGKIVFGIAHSLLGLLLVLGGTFTMFERLMSIAVGVMFVTVLVTAVLLQPDWGAVASGLVVPRIPEVKESVAWTVALMGGVGGTLTVMCYGYWIREKGRSGIKHVRTCRMDLMAAYSVTALFGIAMVIIASGMQISGKGANLVVDLADHLEQPAGQTGRMIFLVGAWAALFSSLLGVWQAIPYLFADFWALFRRHGRLDPATFAAARVDTTARPYRFYLIFIATVPMLGLGYSFELVQKLNSIFGALVMPMLALALLILNGRTKWVGRAMRNGPVTVIALVLTLGFFAWVGLPKIYALMTAL